MSIYSTEPVGRSLVRTVATDEVAGIGADAAEIALDSVLNEGLLQEIPVISTVVRLIKAGGAVRDELFLRKLLLFLQELHRTPVKERQEFIAKHAADAESQQRLGENLVLALERLDDFGKPQVLARLFAAYMLEEINLETFSRLRAALDRFNLDVLPHLQWYYLCTGERVELTEEIEHELSLAGLVTVRLAGSGTIAGAAHYGGNELGKQRFELDSVCNVSRSQPNNGVVFARSARRTATPLCGSAVAHARR